MKTYKVIVPFSGVATYIGVANNPKELYDSLQDESFMEEASINIDKINVESALAVEINKKIKS